MSMQNSSDTIGNWTHDLPACSTVPQPTFLRYHSIRQLHLHFPSHALPCAITFQLDSTTNKYTINITTVFLYIIYTATCFNIFMSSSI
jgi:hypothetical protein